VTRFYLSVSGCPIAHSVKPWVIDCHLEQPYSRNILKR